MLARWSCKAILSRGALLASLAGPFVAEPAWAQGMPPRDHAYRLDLVRGPGTEECPSGLALAEAMRGELRRTTVDPFGDLPTVGRVKVAIAREGSSWRVSLSGWNQELHPFRRQDAVFDDEEPCEQIWPKVATMAARMIEVPLVEKEVPPLPPPPARETVVIAPGPPPWEWRFGAGSEVGWGMLPKFGLGVRVEAGGRRGKFSALLELRQRTPVNVNNGPHAGFSSHTGAFVAGGCYHLWLLGACPLVALGWFNAQGLALDTQSHATVFYAGLGARALVEFPLPGPIALRFETDSMGALLRARVTANFGDVLWTMPWFTWSSAIKLVYTHR